MGGHLAKRLRRDGYWVRGADLKFQEYSETEATDFVVGDLRDHGFCRAIVDRRFDEVYQLAADMGLILDCPSYQGNSGGPVF